MPGRSKRKKISVPENDGGGATAAAYSSTEHDYISDLPECLLHSILSLVPILDAVRTSILSSRWRSLWTFTSLNIGETDFRPLVPKTQGKEDWLVRAVHGILSRHQGPIHTFEFGCHASLSPSYWVRFYLWVMYVVEGTGIRELHLSGDAKRWFPIPDCVLACESLRSLSLDCCELPLLGSILPPVRLLKLRELYLYDVPLDDDLVATLLSACQLLELLVLMDCRDLQNIRIRLPHLRYFYIRTGTPSNVVVEDAPELRDLLIMDFANIRVLHAPKITTLGLVDMASDYIEVCGNNIATFTPNELGNYLGGPIHNLKTLGVKLDFGSKLHLAMLSKLLLYCTNLERLDIMNFGIGKPTWYLKDWEKKGSFACLEHHLQNVNIMGFHGGHSDLEFVKFLIANAQVLKKLELYCDNFVTIQWKKQTWHRLETKNKVSAEAKVIMSRCWHIEDMCPWDGDVNP